MSESVLRPLLVSVSESVSGPKKFTKKVFYAVSDGWHHWMIVDLELEAIDEICV